MTIADKHGIALRQHDVVRFAEDYNLTSSEKQRCPKGTYAVVNGENWSYFEHRLASNYVSLTTITGATVRPLTTRVEKVPGVWQAAAEVRLDSLKPGETLVRPIYNVTAGVGASAETFEKYGIHVLQGVAGSSPWTEFRIKVNDSKHSWARANFEVFVPDAAVVPNPNSRATAMRVEKARELVAKLRAENPRATYRVRSRSWDNDGLYAAIEQVNTNGQAVAGSAMYTEAKVAEHLALLDAAKVPVDIVGTKRGIYWEFKTPAGAVIPAPDKADVWDEGEIRQEKGLAHYAGVKYRLMHEFKEVRPFVA